MADKLLRHIPSGIVYIWQPEYAQRADFEEYEPELAAPVAAPAEAAAPKARAVRKKVESEPVVIDEAALSADASRNLP
ncbi:MAG: hypothetical protein ACKOW0_00835 [Schleiferiaceae bacterium]